MVFIVPIGNRVGDGQEILNLLSERRWSSGIGLGIFLSLFLSELLGVTAGGIIVPGYMSLYLHNQFSNYNFLVAVCMVDYSIVSKYVFSGGIVLALILGFIFGLTRNYLVHSTELGSLEVIGNIIPNYY